MKGAGGTEGGLGSFLFGAAMVVAGGYLLMTRVTVSTSFWTFYGYNAFGISLIPLLIGIGRLFFDGKSRWGWFLTGAGALIIFVGILMNMSIFFRSTTLFDTMVILVLIAGGVGIVARSLQPMTNREPERR